MLGFLTNPMMLSTQWLPVTNLAVLSFEILLASDWKLSFSLTFSNSDLTKSTEANFTCPLGH